MNYLFLSVPPFCGSTVLHNYIAKCENVVPLTNEFPGYNTFGMIEGNVATRAKTLYGNLDIPTLTTIPGSMIDVIQNTTHYDWEGIKEAFDANWERGNSNATVRLQKTPNDTYRIQLMQPTFDAKWIIMVREPFAYTQSIIEKLLKLGINPSSMADDIACHVINTYAIQKENKEFLGDKAYTMTLEDFIENPQTHIDGLKSFIPELSDLTFDGEVQVKDKLVNGLVNNNSEKLELFATIPNAISKFTELFAPHKDIIEYWGYKAEL